MPVIFTLACAVFALIGSIAIRFETHTTRWLVKTMTDRDTTAVQLDHPRWTTVHEQAELPAARVRSSTPRLNSERTLYSLDAYLLGAKLELDGDYHLILGDPETKSTIIAEIPDDHPQKVRSSSRAMLFRSARRTVDSLTIPDETEMHLFRPPIRVRVTGIGFYDEPHIIQQEMESSNSREIHPVLTIEVLRR